jgi:hypothetical protein
MILYPKYPNACLNCINYEALTIREFSPRDSVPHPYRELHYGLCDQGAKGRCPAG